MARIKLGTIVTSIQGSIGGNCFKKTKNGTSMGLKSFGGSRNKLLSNIRLGSIAVIFQLWSRLTESQRTDWSNAALLFVFPNKFGTNTSLSGRQLFVKLNIQLSPFGVNVIDATGINSDNSELLIDLSTYNLTTKVINFDLVQVNGLSNVLVYAQVCLNKSTVKDFSKAKFLKFLTLPANGTYDVSNEFNVVYPNVSINNNVFLFITPINAFGFKGVTVGELVGINP